MMRTIILAGLIVSTSIGFGQEEPVKHRIDKWLNAAMDRDSTTTGMIQATAKASEMWDAELNSVYKLLIESLAKPEADKLKASQRKWIEFRDAEFAFSDGFYSKAEGTMWRPVSASSRLEVVRSRTLELQGYLDNLGDM